MKEYAEKYLPYWAQHVVYGNGKLRPLLYVDDRIMELDEQVDFLKVRK